MKYGEKGHSGTVDFAGQGDVIFADSAPGGARFVCAPWARSRRWKSWTCPGSGKCIAEQQGCPSWGGIWRKPTAKSRSEGHELHMRLTRNGRVCITKQSPTLPETLGVNVADIWDEGCCSYVGRSDRYIINKGWVSKMITCIVICSWTIRSQQMS